VIPDSQLIAFRFNKSSHGAALKILEEREILVNGKLYDVARKTDDGNSITYFCVYDRDEETLIAKTRQFNSQSQPFPVQNTARLIFDKIIKTCILDTYSEIYAENYTVLSSLLIEKHYSVPTLQISIPPPQPLIFYFVV
jgi:hypothetical protein